jgi:hypothetical protein
MHRQTVRRLGLERDPHDSTTHGWQDLTRLHKHEHVNVALAPELTTCVRTEQHHADDRSRTWACVACWWHYARRPRLTLSTAWRWRPEAATRADPRPGELTIIRVWRTVALFWVANIKGGHAEWT